MFSYPFYKVVHLVGIAILVVALAGFAMHAATGGTRAENPARRLLAVLHGLGAFLVLLGGFGLLARLGVQHGSGFPGWIWTKLGVWVLLAGAIVLPYRRRPLALPLLLALPVCVGLAAYMAIYKPI